jgi:nicotinate dehydrogenase subunit A
MTSDEPVQRTLTVNGRRVSVLTEDETALLYVLRNHLGLKGTRFGCGLGVCGACYVLVDGRPTYSCDTPVSAVEGAEITTVEGLGDASDPHPVVQALQNAQAAQCGYCMSGIVVKCAALLTDIPHPTREDVCAALDGNLCRCGAHNRVIRGVLAAAAAMDQDHG